MARAPPVIPPPLDPLPVPMPHPREDPAAIPVDQESDNALTDSVVNQAFDRVQWAKCQARAERYEEEVELVVEEMGRTLRYFEWKREWWLSFVSDRSDESDASGGSNAPGTSSVPGKSNVSDKSDASLPLDVQGGLRAYAYRQSDVYNNLIASFVGHWRKYLVAHSLGATWLTNYPPSLDPTPTRPSRGHRRSDVGPSPVAEVPATSSTSEPLITHDSDTDAPLDGENDDGTSGESDAEIDAEELLEED